MERQQKEKEAAAAKGKGGDDAPKGMMPGFLIHLHNSPSSANNSEQFGALPLNQSQARPGRVSQYLISDRILNIFHLALHSCRRHR